MIYYHKEKKWEERFYHGVVTEVGDSVLREWDGEKKKLHCHDARGLWLSV